MARCGVARIYQRQGWRWAGWLVAFCSLVRVGAIARRVPTFPHALWHDICTDSKPQYASFYNPFTNIILDKLAGQKPKITTSLYRTLVAGVRVRPCNIEGLERVYKGVGDYLIVMLIVGIRRASYGGS